MKVITDTSALLSLAAGDILDLTLESIGCIIPVRVKEEVKGISRNNTFEGNLAKKVFAYIDQEIVVIETNKSSPDGEIECAYLANQIKDAELVITDDTNAIEKLEKICDTKIRFSTIILYALYLKGRINKDRARIVLERMRVKRDWKDNIIYEQAILLLDSLGEI